MSRLYPVFLRLEERRVLLVGAGQPEVMGEECSA
jgi:siroheme synthase (precorrin-2 oxidase/ferrochelatase)